MTLQFMEQRPLNPMLVMCPYCQKPHNIGIHSHQERRYKCHACGRTFAETKGTMFYGLQYPVWVVILVVALLSHGCPVAAIVAALYVDERTVVLWLNKAGLHAKTVQEQIVCAGQVDVGHVQLDELCVTTQLGKIWVATAMSVFSRLFLWGEVSTCRDKALILSVLDHVKAAAVSHTDAVLFAVDGFAAYPKAI